MKKQNIKQLFSKEAITVLKDKRVFNKKEKRNDLFLLDKVSQNKKEKRSKYGARMGEFKKIMKFYGKLSRKYLKNKIKLFQNNPNHVEENFFRYLESRLDVILWRASFFDSIASAKQAIQSSHVQVNKITVTTPAHILKPGDLISLLSNKNKKDFYSDKTRILRKKSISSFRKVEKLLLKNISISKKRKKQIPNTTKLCRIVTPFRETSRECLSFQNLIDLIISSLRTVTSLPFQTIDRSSNRTTSNFMISESFSRKETLLTIAEDPKIRLAHQPSKSEGAKRFIEGSSEKNFPNGVKQIFDSSCSKNPDYSNKHYFVVLNYYLYLKRALNHNRINQIIRQGYSFKDQNVFQKQKPTHLEISYKSLSIILLFPPQHVTFSDFINYSHIFK